MLLQISAVEAVSNVSLFRTAVCRREPWANMPYLHVLMDTDGHAIGTIQLWVIHTAIVQRRFEPFALVPHSFSFLYISRFWRAKEGFQGVRSPRSLYTISLPHLQLTSLARYPTSRSLDDFWNCGNYICSAAEGRGQVYIWRWWSTSYPDLNARVKRAAEVVCSKSKSKVDLSITPAGTFTDRLDHRARLSIMLYNDAWLFEELHTLTVFITPKTSDCLDCVPERRYNSVVYKNKKS